MRWATGGAPNEAAGLDFEAAGSRRRAERRRRKLGVAVLALALLAVPTAVLRSNDGSPPEEIDFAAGDDGTAATVAVAPEESASGKDSTAVTEASPALPAWLPPPPPGTEPPLTDPPVVPPPATAAPATTPKPPAPATTASTVCRNSDDPACGDFRWEPAPSPNQPLVGAFTKAPSTAVTGQLVEFEVVWSDADARLTFDRFSTDGSAIGSPCTLAPRFGPWTPPAAVGGTGTLRYTTTFRTAGTYAVGVQLGTADCTSPYSDDTQLRTTITVVAPAP